MTRPSVQLPDEIRRQIVDHCLAGRPNEACGLLAIDGNRVVKVYPTANEDDSPVSYTIPPREHFDALEDAESSGWEIGGAFHSHPTGPARMSATDLAKAFERDWVYVVVGLAGGISLGAWRDGAEIDILSSLPF